MDSSITPATATSAAAAAATTIKTIQNTNVNLNIDLNNNDIATATTLQLMLAKNYELYEKQHQQQQHHNHSSLLDLSTSTISSAPNVLVHPPLKPVNRIISSDTSSVQHHHHHHHHRHSQNHHTNNFNSSLSTTIPVSSSFVEHNAHSNNLSGSINSNQSNSGIIIQQSTMKSPSKSTTTITLPDIYNLTANDFTIDLGSHQNGSHLKTNDNQQQQLVQLLKPFYNTMQLHQQIERHNLHQQQREPSSFMTSDNNVYLIDSDRKLIHQDTTNHHSRQQSSFITQSNEYVQTLLQQNAEISANNHQSTNTYRNDFNINGNRSSSSSTSMNLDPININNDNKFESGFQSNLASIIETNSINNSNKNEEKNESTDPPPPQPPKTTRGRKKSRKGPFICQECHKEFCNQSTLTKHMITHSDERKFVCPECSKAFKRHDHLNGHMLTHREHKPYACDIEGCDKSYCDARSLRRHKEKHKENALAALQFAESSVTTSISSEQLSINASKQLQFFASQQKKSENLQQQNEIVNVKTNLPAETSGTQSNLSNENALLHQLLTTTNTTQPDKMSDQQSVAHHRRRSIIQTNMNNNLTAVKINDNYMNVCENSTVNSLEKTIESLIVDHGSMRSNVSASTNHLQMNNQAYQETNMKNYEMDNTKNFVQIYGQNLSNQQSQVYHNHYLHQQTNKQLDDLFDVNKTMTSANHDDLIEFRNSIFQHTSQQQQNQSNAQFLSHQMINNNGQLYQNGDNHSNHQHQQSPNIIVDNHSNYSIIRTDSNSVQAQSQPQQQQTKGLNEVMFSPITPVTPLKNDSQFTFEFAANNSQQPPQVSDKNNVTVVTITNNDQHQQQQNNELNYAESTELKSTIHDYNQDENFATATTTESTVNLPINTQQEQQISFNNFDLPSTKLTSDLFNRRLQRNNQCMNDSSRTKELLSIKQIAASLESFSQNYERNQRLNQQQNQMTNQQQLCHSYSVPTTPFQLNPHNQTFDSSNAPNSNHQHNESYDLQSLHNQQQQLLPNHHQHHSLPTTPIDHHHNHLNHLHHNHHHHHHHQQHFTFNTDSIYNQTNQQQQISSMPNTPLENDDNQQQFSFIFTQETSTTNVAENTAAVPAPTVATNSSITGDSNTNDLIMGEIVTNCLEDNGNGDPGATDATIAATFTDFTQNIEQVFDNLNQENESKNAANCESSMQFSQPSTVDASTTTNSEYYSTSIEPFAYDSNANVSSNNQETKSLNSMQFIAPSAPEKTSNVQSSNSKNQIMEVDVNDNYIMKSESQKSLQSSSSEKSSENNPLSHIKSSSNFIKSLNKKLSAISNDQSNNDNAVKKIVPPSSVMKKKKPRPEPLYIPPHVNTSFVYHSRLRSPRLWNGVASGGGGGIMKPSPQSCHKTDNIHHLNHHLHYNHISPPPYTPPPMLSPVRSGSGLFWKINNFNLNQNHINNKLSLNSYSSATTSNFFNNNKKLIQFDNATFKENQNYDQQLIAVNDLKTPTTAYEPEYEYNDIPATDIQPHVNIGHQYQARIPAFNPNRSKALNKSDHAVLLWSPSVLSQSKIDDEQIELYLKLSCSMCINGNGNNVEYALHLLFDCNGNIYDAIEKLIQINPSFNQSNPLYDYYYANNDVWNENEISLFQKSIFKYDKDFYLIAKDIKTKTVKECVQFYYIWKKNSIDHFKRLRIIRRKRESMFYDLEKANRSQMTTDDDDQQKQMIIDDDQMFDTVNSSNVANGGKSSKMYHCKICGKKFRNLKSRSAHMRAHIH